MKAGDIVKRKIKGPIDARLVEKNGKYGVVLRVTMKGETPSLCADVMWPRSRSIYSISTYYIEVINENR